MSVTIVLADDHPLVRKGLKAVLEAEADFRVVAEAGDGLEALRLVEKLEPDVLVIDLMLPGLSGLDVLSIACQRSPRTRAVVLSMYNDEEFVFQALKNGAIGYVLKGAAPADAVEAIRRAAAGRRFLSAELSDRALDAYCEKAQAAPDPHDLLTPRERQALQLAAEGCTNAAIATRLSISPRTAEMHRASAQHKLGLKSQAELIRYAIRRGMIPPLS